MKQLLVLLVITFFNFNYCVNSTKNNEKTCFYKLTGNVDDCDCKIEDIIRFNNYHLKPRLEELRRKNYFRYFKVNLYKICQFWHDDARCSVKDCLVKTCSDEDLPQAFQRYLKEENESLQKEDDMGSNCEQLNPLGHLNETITDENLKTFETWTKYDDSRDNFCEPDDEYMEKAKYVDLLANPERYTGYKGDHAHKIWNSIYKENCFKEVTRKNYANSLQNRDTCFEKRIFHRLVSGLHSSINVHLCSNFLHEGIIGQPEYWGPAPNEFRKRFDPKTTNGEGPKWLRNLYFVYLVELRAITKAAPYLEQQVYYTGDPENDKETRVLVLDLLQNMKKFENNFDETKMFRGDSKEAKKLKEQFKLQFRNITKIMDCVGCDKCRLWGKLQTQALGTALKILFSDVKNFKVSNHESKQGFQLSRAEIVALINGFARLSTSIVEVENFKDLLSSSYKEL